MKWAVLLLAAVIVLCLSSGRCDGTPRLVAAPASERIPCPAEGTVGLKLRRGSFFNAPATPVSFFATAARVLATALASGPTMLSALAAPMARDRGFPGHVTICCLICPCN